MSEPSREAAEAAALEYARFEKGSLGNDDYQILWREGTEGKYRVISIYDTAEERNAALPTVRMQAALTAALPHLISAKDAEIAALREVLTSIKMVDGYGTLYIGVITDNGCWSVKIEEQQAIDMFKEWGKKLAAALEMSGGVL